MPKRRKTKGEIHFVLGIGGLTIVACVAAGCMSGGGQHVEPLAGSEKLDHATAAFGIYWPPQDPEEAHAASTKPLLRGTLTVNASEQPAGDTVLQLTVTLTRPSAEADREYWNKVLAYADIPWMDQVRVWDKDETWLWPNLPYLLRLPGQERVERYGGMDPGKHVDNDFAAVLIRKYDASGTVESSETKDTPLVSAEWHTVDAAKTDLHTVVHVAQSDEFLVHVGDAKGPARGQFKVWLIYADFLHATAPPTWPHTREWAGGILAYVEIDWEVSPEDGCRGVLRHRRPPAATRFNWSDWVVRQPDADESQAAVRLSDVEPSR